MTKILIIALIVLILLVFSSLMNYKPATAEPAAVYKRISAEEAFDMMQQSQVIIVDVRTRAEFESGHIQGAINIPNEHIGTKPLQELVDFDATLLIYCRSGARSAQAANKLLRIGYTDVYD
ncbi:MAG: rhodanese-like domain-containing protein, partial [Spirochaetia bacterium]|nr:rhodanese-like domain-containing protein [Spirochaetia bacterium]